MSVSRKGAPEDNALIESFIPWIPATLAAVPPEAASECQ